MGKVVNLAMVTDYANNNKYYRMTELGDGTWRAEYGRIGASPQTRIYPMSQWDSKYREKIRKGYTDRTDLCVTSVASRDNSYKDIEVPSIQKLVDNLMNCASTAVKKNYTVAAEQVTQQMVTEAQGYINTLFKTTDINLFNRTLLNLYTALPRRMYNVRETLASSSSDIPQILKREQDLLDIMKGQVIQHITTTQVTDKKEITILEALGLKVREVSPREQSIILKQLGRLSNRYVQAWRVTNKATQQRYNAYLKQSGITNTKLLWHGSRTENWWSILQTGLVLNPSAAITGKMFGYGIYYAPSAQKSLGYTSLSGAYWTGGKSTTGYMALMDVAYGRPMDVYSFEPQYSNLTANRLGNYDCLHAHKDRGMLRNDEIVIYREEQSTIKFLVELH